MGAATVTQTLPSTRAGGQDDGSLHKLPQNIEITLEQHRHNIKIHMDAARCERSRHGTTAVLLGIALHVFLVSKTICPAPGPGLPLDLHRRRRGGHGSRPASRGFPGGHLRTR